MKRSARRCGILHPLWLSLEEIKERLRVCKEECKYYRKHGHRHRRKHLQNRLQAARDRSDEEAEHRILVILAREKSRSYWRRLNYSMAKPKGRSVRTVHTTTEDGEIIEHTTQQGVQDSIWQEIHGQRFYLVEQAPICQGQLRGDFGYMAFSPTTKQVLEGSYNYPADFDPATCQLCKECARIRQCIPNNCISTDIDTSQ